MKTHTSRRKNGFTLVELLVVIAIIAVLAGAGFAAGSAAIQKAKRTTALATCVSIEQAINNFYTEYATLPVANPTAAALNTSASSGLPLVKTLLGDTATASTDLNPRTIKFLSLKEGKAKGTKGINGIVYSAGTTSDVKGIYDPWGGGYLIALDDNYNEIVTPTYTPSMTLNGRRCAVWTLGADAAATGSGGAVTDDVTTWK